ncbi:uncharacterized protein ACIBXB_000603 [Morphnus guianensis]
MPLTAAASGLRGLSLPGLPLLAAQEHRGTGGAALTGCGQELLKLERSQKGKEEETEGRLAGSCLLLQARESLPLCVQKDPSSYSTAGQTTNVHHSGGQPSNWSYRRGREEKEKETSELGKASGSAESKSCGGCQLPLFHRGCPFFCCESTRQMERFRSGLQVQALFTKRARCKAAAAAQGL